MVIFWETNFSISPPMMLRMVLIPWYAVALACESWLNFTGLNYWYAGMLRKVKLFKLICLILAVILHAQAAPVCAATDSGASRPAALAGAHKDQPDLTFCFQGKLPNHRLIVVNKSLQRLMVYHYLGEFVLEQEYPCATGTNPGSKQKEGDERTPVGIYFTTHRFKDSKVTIFGDRAIHLNYPNPFDKAAGHKGNGIYIHGTNQKLKPRSSNGCITLRNSDLARIYGLIVEQQTPVVVVESLKFAETAQRTKACNYLDKLAKDVLHPIEASQEPTLSILPVLGKKPEIFEQSAPGLAGMGQYRPRSINISNNGLMLLGLGDEWVLIADQSIDYRGKKGLGVTRRFYLDGSSPQGAELIQNHWLVKNRAMAKRLLAWAPEPQKTIASKTPSQPKPALSKRDKDLEIKKMLARWIRDWQNKNLNSYIRHYSRDFNSNNMNRRAWRKHKAYLNKVYKVIRVSADKININVKGDSARVVFVQHYRSDWHRDVGVKELDLVYSKGRWQIRKESWRKLGNTQKGIAQKSGRKGG